MLALTLLLLSATPSKAVAAAPAPNAEVEKLRTEVAQLRVRLEKLEKRFADEDEERETRIANTAQIRSTIESVMKQLQSGDTKGVDAQLKAIEKIALPDTAKLLAAARASLAQNDLANARGSLMLAIASAGF